MRRGLLQALALAWLAIAAGSAAAEQTGMVPAGPALEAGMKPLPRTLSGAALKECVRLDEDVRAAGSQIGIRRPYLHAAEQDYLGKGRSLDARAAGLDRSNADDVARYNRDVQAHAAAIQAYDAMLPEFNALVARHNEGVDRFNRECAERPYYRQQWLQASAALRREAAGAR